MVSQQRGVEGATTMSEQTMEQREALNTADVLRANGLIDSIMSPQAGEHREAITLRVAHELHRYVFDAARAQMEQDCKAVCVDCDEGVILCRRWGYGHEYFHDDGVVLLFCKADAIRRAWDAAHATAH